MLDQDLLRSAAREENLVVDSITSLLCSLTYRNVQIMLLWLQKKKINNLWQLLHLPLQDSSCQNLNPRAISPGFPQAYTAELLRLLKCFFSLPVGVLTPHVPEPSLTHTHAHIRTHTRRPANMHSLTHTFPSTSYSQSISAQRIQIPEQLCLAFILCWVSKNAGVSGPETEQEKSSLDLETVVRVLGPLGQADMGSTARFLELFFSHPVEVQCVLHPFWGIVCSFSWGHFKQGGRINASPYSL